VLAASLRDAAQCFAGVHGLAVRGEIAERDDAHQPLVAVEHGQATHLDIAHVLQHGADFLVIEAIFDVRCHDIADRRFRTFAQGNAAHRDIAVSDHADQLIAVGDR
jgi:hypothetical protein